MRSVAIIGCGYTGIRLARRWLGAGHAVRGFGTRPDSLREIAASGAQAVLLDLDTSPAAIAVAENLVYYTVPPPRDGTHDARLERFLSGMSGRPERLIYFSTTGVYGNHGGQHVSEDTPPSPSTPRAVRRLAAESALRAWADARDISWTILRIPGIYGPGRLPLERLQRGDPTIIENEATPGNRIHVDDLAMVAETAGAARVAHRRIYNVTDGSDESLTAYLNRVARIAGLPAPPLISRADALRTFTASTWSFLGESRRVDNARMLTELNVTLAYADLDDGIRASL